MQSDELFKECIDPTNFNDVISAMCTRCDPRDQVDIIHGGWTAAGTAPPQEYRPTNRGVLLERNSKISDP